MPGSRQIVQPMLHCRSIGEPFSVIDFETQIRRSKDGKPVIWLLPMAIAGMAEDRRLPYGYANSTRRNADLSEYALITAVISIDSSDVRPRQKWVFEEGGHYFISVETA